MCGSDTPVREIDRTNPSIYYTFTCSQCGTHIESQQAEGAAFEAEFHNFTCGSRAGVCLVDLEA